MRPMKTTKIILCLCFLLFLLAGCGNASAIPEDIPTGNQAALPCNFYDQTVFEKNLRQATEYELSGKLLAGVSPHYPPAMTHTTSLLKTALDQGESYDTIVIVGPNHEGTGNPVSLANMAWQTPFGLAEADDETIDALLRSPTIIPRVDNDLLVKDQAAATLVPYTHYFFPEAKIVTILLSRGANLSQIQELAACLTQISKEKSLLLLCSIDFSHYQAYQETLSRDKETLAAIEANDQASLKVMDGKNLDSPETFLTLLSLKDKTPGSTLTLLDTMIQRDLPPKENLAYSYHLYVLTH